MNFKELKNLKASAQENNVDNIDKNKFKINFESRDFVKKEFVKRGLDGG